MKVCTRCNQIKPLSEFYRQTANPTGYAPHCKLCHRRAYPDRPWNRTQQGRQSARRAAGAWSRRNRQKVRAYSRLRYHLAMGYITKPTECEHCQRVTRLDAHHPDYTKPLDVVWLCRSCHKQEHA